MTIYLDPKKKLIAQANVFPVIDPEGNVVPLILWSKKAMRIITKSKYDHSYEKEYCKGN